MITPNPPHEDQHTADDALLNRYQEANTHDARRPSPTLRDRVLTQARTMAEKQAPADTLNQPPAANDSAWKVRALGSLAVLGLVGLLMLHFDRGTPEVQSVAWGPATSTPPPVPSSDARASKAGPDTSPATNDAMREPPASAAQPLPGASAGKGHEPPQLPGAEGSRTHRDTAPGQAHIARTRTDETTGVVAALEQEQEQKRHFNASDEAAVVQVQPLPPAANEAREPLPTRRDTPLNERSASLATMPDSNTALHEATKAGNADAIRHALAQGSSVDATDSEGRTALMLAAQGPSKAVVEQLLKAGANRALRDRQGLNAADHARLAGRLTWLELLQP